MFTSIIIPFRDPRPIPLCLTSLEFCEGISSHAVAVIQHGGRRIDANGRHLNLQYFYLPDDGPFHMARVYNLAVKAARTEWVTLLDPWLLVPPDFITTMEAEIFSEEGDLAYFPVRYLDSDATEQIAQRYNAFYENIIPVSDDWRLRGETFEGRTVGTDCIVVKRSAFLDMGGYDENYHDAHLAHLDFSCRWLNSYAPLRCATCQLYHRWSPLGVCGCSALRAAVAQIYFADRHDAGFPPLEKIAH
jgi:hypothetical protein